jgi:hypothetical protein
MQLESRLRFCLAKVLEPLEVQLIEFIVPTWSGEHFDKYDHWCWLLRGRNRGETGKG